MLNIELRNQIKNYALENPNEEFCGLLLASGDCQLIYKCKNISSNKDKHFELSPLDYLRAWDEGRNKIIGLIHSQKSTRPSTLDILNYRNFKIPSYIYSIEADDFIEVTDCHFKYNNYLGKNFEINKQDCFSLVRAFYKTERNIEITDYHREDNWFHAFPDIAGQVYEREGFIKIDFKDIIEGDILEFNHGHFGIYLEGDLLMHHERRRFSSIEALTYTWKKRITNCYRHKNE
jgi:proteasome lid subunit RPN8/RPN11